MNNSNNLKCIKDNCSKYFCSDNYYETCYLLSKRVLLDRCYGIAEIPNKKEEIICKIAKLTEKLNNLNELEKLIRENQ